MHGTGTTHGTPRDTLADLDDALWTLYASGARDPGDNPSAVRRLEACRSDIFFDQAADSRRHWSVGPQPTALPVKKQ